MIERLLWLLKWLETKEGTQDERKIINVTKMVRNQIRNPRGIERLLRPLKWLETNEGTQEDREIIKATKMVRDQ
jgi:hypothetical protein